MSIGELVSQAHFGSPDQQQAAFSELLAQAKTQGCAPASIYPIYKARAEGTLPPNFTVPAMNLRGLSYLTAQAAFAAAHQHKVGVMVFELAQSEMRYTDQTPLQIACSVLGAALKTGWTQPIFLQGDHFQPKAERPGVIKPGELESVKELTQRALAAGFYNLDIDGSTLVDNSKFSQLAQQQPNIDFTVEMIRFIRAHQVTETPISIGCEIAEVGSHLSKPSQLKAFMRGLQKQLPPEIIGPIKVAVETGTKHGGSVNPDGTAGPMKVEFGMLKRLSQIARQKYGLAGAVQHGASTLTKDMFQRFPDCETLEIHLSTGFQNTILDHAAFPADLRQKMYAWCDANCAAERKPDWTDAQFYAKTRKKAWGPFKKETWELPAEIQAAIKASLQQECALYFESLRVSDTAQLASGMVKT